MSEIVFRLPAKSITYGYVEIKATPEELGDPGLLASPEALGQVYAQFVYAFLKGEQAAAQAALSGKADKYTAEAEADADQLIKSELGGIEIKGGKLSEGGSSALANEYSKQAVALAEHAVGVNQMTHLDKPNAAPWDKKVQPTVKPWETKKTGATTTPVKRATIDFDDF